jgi:adenosylmethionine---8-amino-7-oxononanoate aminotransferase
MTHPRWYTEGIDHIWPPYGQFPSSPAPLPVARTQGCRIILEDGRELIDGVSSWWSAAHGYNHPHLLEAAHKQLDIMPHVMFGGLAHEPAYTLASRLSAITPGQGDKDTGLTRVFFADSGSIATEVAMKIALQYWMNLGKRNKTRFICMHDGYHGDTMGTMAVSDPVHGMHKAYGHLQRQHFAMAIPTGEYSLAEFTETLEAIAYQSAALIIEPLVQGAGGMRFHSPDILAEIRRLCKEHDILFIADEVATGFCRTGNRFACDEADIIPDILCLGKGLTGGVMSLAATLTTEEIYACFVGDDPEQALMHGPTFMANPLACAVANASLDLFEREPRLAQANIIETHMFAALEPLSDLSGVVDVRVKGAIAAVQLAKEFVNIPELRRTFASHDVWIRPFRDVIYLMPPLTISSEELSTLTNAVTSVTQDWSREVRGKVNHLFE